MLKFTFVYAALACLLSASAYALPTLQAHLVNSVAGDHTSPAIDQDTWFNTYSAAGAHKLELIASYGVHSKISDISDGYLVLTVSPNDPNPTPANFRFFSSLPPVFSLRLSISAITVMKTMPRLRRRSPTPAVWRLTSTAIALMGCRHPRSTYMAFRSIDSSPV